jgi:hypothetical protein
MLKLVKKNKHRQKPFQQKVALEDATDEHVDVSEEARA